jgi:spore photoproduct lyase
VISAIYIEQAVAGHPATIAITRRFPDAVRIPIERYGEVFNRKAQNFRLQKKRPALILAHKHDHHVLPAPPGYGIGMAHNFYMSHMLNCVYDCRYCFLQGMYRSAHYVLFVNFEDFQAAMAETLATVSTGEACFFSGYDCDSLALEPVSGYVESLLPFFEQHSRSWLELRTKSTQIRTLLKRPALDNVVVAFSFTPASIADVLEHKVPSVERRIDAMQKLAGHGWPLGLRFDPMIYDGDYRYHYGELFDAIFSRIQPRHLHSVAFGPFRLPQPFYRAMHRLYPDEPLLAGHFTERNGMISYPAAIEREMIEFCSSELLRYIPENILFPCEF